MVYSTETKMAAFKALIEAANSSVVKAHQWNSDDVIREVAENVPDEWVAQTDTWRVAFGLNDGSSFSTTIDLDIANRFRAEEQIAAEIAFVLSEKDPNDEPQAKDYKDQLIALATSLGARVSIETGQWGFNGDNGIEEDLMIHYPDGPWSMSLERCRLVDAVEIIVGHRLSQMLDEGTGSHTPANPDLVNWAFAMDPSLNDDHSNARA